MAEAAKGIEGPEITTEVKEQVKEQVKEIVTEVKEATAEVKEAAAEVVDELPKKRPQLVTLRETISREGFDDKRGLRRVWALWGATNSPFFR